MGFFVFANSASAATYYVSQVATNGYVIGSDSNDGLTKGAAKLTIGSAVTAATAGDTIYLNDGTYDYGAGVLNINKGISLQSETDYGAIITNNGGAAYMFALQAGITGTFTLGKVVLTEATANNKLMYIFAPTTKYSLVIDGTKFLNYYKIALFLGNSNTDIDLTIQNAIFTSNTILGTGGNYYAIQGDAIRNGNVLITGNTFTHSPPVTGNSRTVIAIAKSGDSSTVTVSNNTITDHIGGGTLDNISLTATALTSSTFTISGNTIVATSTGGTVYGIHVIASGAASLAPIVQGNIMNLDGGGATSGSITGIYTENTNSIISANTVSATSTNATVVGVKTDAVSTILCDNIKVYGNTVTMSSPVGYGILIGGESTGARYTYLTHPQVYSNRVVFDEATTTSAHGIMFGYIKYGLGWNNYSSGNNILYLIKGALDTTFYNNVAVNPITTGVSNAQALRLKGASNGQFINNTVVITNTARSGYDMAFDADADTAVSTGSYINNSVYSTKTLLEYISVEASSVVSFANNNYYGSANDFVYQGTGYSTISSWQSAHESTASTTNPNFANINTSFALASSSSLIDAGATNSISSTTGDYLGNPIYGTPDIGAYEYQPPFTIGTNDLDVTGDIRIYGNGKYRYTTATSSTMSANFSVSPPEGVWTYSASTTRPEWLNISDITWNTSGTYSKQWTASSTIATTTVYTIGDLQPSTQYTVRVDSATSTDITGDSCTGSICESDGGGQIVFTYSGGYSTHDFNVDPASIPTLTTNSPSAITTTSATANGNIDAIGDDSPTTRGFLYGTDSTLVTVIATTTETGTFGTGAFTASLSGFTCGNTYYIRSYATNSGGTGYGSIVSFNTSACPSSSSGGSSARYIPPVQNATTTTTIATSTQLIIARTFFRDLKLGMTGDDVKELQRLLNKQGFNIASIGLGSPGNETNYFGLLTQKALIRFQTSHNITPAIGYFGPLTRAVVNGTQAPSTASVSTTTFPFTLNLAYGSTGEDVRQLQIFLNSHGYTVAISGHGSLGNETNYFGLVTQSALIKFQIAQGISPAVGFFGPVTRKVVGEMK